jgi:hypothetical protein
MKLKEINFTDYCQSCGHHQTDGGRCANCGSVMHDGNVLTFSVIVAGKKHTVQAETATQIEHALKANEMKADHIESVFTLDGKKQRGPQRTRLTLSFDVTSGDPAVIADFLQHMMKDDEACGVLCYANRVRISIDPKSVDIRQGETTKAVKQETAQ